MLPSMFPPAKTLLHDVLAFDTPSSVYSAKRLILFGFKTNRIVAGCLQSIQIIEYIWIVSASSQRALFKSKIFLLYVRTKVTCKNTLLNNSDDWHFTSQTCSHCQHYCISLCVFNLWCNMQNRRTIRTQILVYFASLFYHFSKNFNNSIKLNICPIESALIFSFPPPFNISEIKKDNGGALLPFRQVQVCLCD